ncbi:two-component system response regulator TorR [Ferrimonas marina]|uniref:Two-component system, OmpR family, torCAD operon response regulator TorR n=1 Tax=Ferrimonas marina TaxID=299255 RepID=A0A1M5VH23_9GAMM|nr:two-component system response regulator TorR [Ferrimonas marina]SHH74549.1 two-component system, OmpR family, torCAD operon response regulator TorR [Ferrimonas marina]
MTDAHRLLVVEDDETTRLRHQGYFEQAGYAVAVADCAKAMQQSLAQQEYDLVLLDLSLPDGDGLALTRELRSHSTIGIILVTGRDEAVDRIVGLEMGADDYVTKPVPMRELLVRVKNLLWRIDLARQAQQTPATPHYRFAGWQFDGLARQLSRDGIPVPLTTAEFELLQAFVSHPQQVMPRERLLGLVSHRVDAPSTRTIDVLVRRLRSKMEGEEDWPKLFVTVHGEGYLFAAGVTLGAS